MPRLDAGRATEHIRSNEAAERPDFTPVESLGFAVGEATSFAEIEAQAQQLLDYIGKLSAVPRRAGEPPLGRSQSAEDKDVGSSGGAPVQSPHESLSKQSDGTLYTFDHAAAHNPGRLAKLNELLSERETQLNEKEAELKHLRAEISCLIRRLDEAEQYTGQLRGVLQNHVEPLEQQIADLQRQLAQREEALQTKNNLLRKMEMNHRAATSEWEQRLRDVEAQVQNQEARIKEKEAIIQATARKEAEMGNLIKRLSTECRTLSLELQEKTRLLNEMETRKPQAAAEGKAWRRVVGRLQEEGI